MVKKSRGTLSTRTRKLRGKSRTSVNDELKTFKKGEKVIVDPKARREGQPYLRYRNKHGIVAERQGNSYVVEINDYKKKKKLIVGPVHLKLAS